jgi:5-methylcytosine-specific restriction protein A
MGFNRPLSKRVGVMPYKTKSPCSNPCCPNLSDGGPCPSCKAKRRKVTDQRRGSSTQRGYSSRWQRYRKAFLSKPENMYCVDCGDVATVIDHKIPHKGNMKVFWDKKNHQPMCKTCHDRKTVREDGGLGR